MTRITKLPVPPEEYKKEILERLNPRVDAHPMMGFDERYFLNGLLAYYQPTNVLELGVNFGEGSAQILHSIRHTPGSKLTSIDLAQYGCYTEVINERTGEKRVQISDEPVGNFALTHPDLPLDRWTLVTGKDPSEVIADLANTAMGYDFLVLDTAHLHPIESLNFLSVLPYLRDGAIVVLHDIMLFTFFAPPRAFACRALFASVVAERIQLNFGLSNIGAFQINGDTRKYIQNVFEALLFPWEIAPSETRTDAIMKLVAEHYTKEEVRLLGRALDINKYYYGTGKVEWICTGGPLTEFFLSELSEKTIFYGAGRNLTACLQYCQRKGIVFDAEIWDIAAGTMNQVLGHVVTVPDFKSSGIGKTLIITIDDKRIREEVRVQFERLGYTVKMYPHK